MQLEVGDVVAGYEVQAVLGHGNMGSVYRARARDGRLVALKVMGAESPPERFLAEAETLAQLDHPGIPRVFDYAMQPVAYLAEEIMEGPTLEQVLARGRMPFDRVHVLAQSLLTVLDVIHVRGFVHRDLNPSNIVVRGEQVCVLDFGVVRLTGSALRRTATGEIVGTLHYLAPEQIDAARGAISARTDVFAAGALLYCMLTGSPPVEGSASRVLRQTLREAPPPMAGVAAPVQAAVFRALEKDPTHRYGSAREFGESLSLAVQQGGRP